MVFWPSPTKAWHSTFVVYHSRHGGIAIRSSVDLAPEMTGLPLGHSAMLAINHRQRWLTVERLAEEIGMSLQPVQAAHSRAQAGPPAPARVVENGSASDLDPGPHRRTTAENLSNASRRRCGFGDAGKN